MKKVLFSLIAASSVIAMSSCSKSSSTPSTTAKVMFVNGCAGTSALGLNVNGTALPSASSIAYLKSSGYQTFTAGSDSFSSVIPGILSVLASTHAQQTTANTSYSVFAGGLVTNGTL